MATKAEIEALIKNLIENGLAANEEDAREMAERMIGKDLSEEDFNMADDAPIRLQDLKPIEKEPHYDITKDRRTIRELSEIGEKFEKEKTDRKRRLT